MTQPPPQNSFGSLATSENLSHPPRPPRIRFFGKVLTAEYGGLRVSAEAREHCALFSNGMWLVLEGSADLPIVKDVMALAARKGHKIIDTRIVSADVLVQAENYAKRANPRLPQWAFVVFCALITLTFLGFGGRLIWFFDLFGYFRVHYAIIGFVIFVMTLRAKNLAYSAIGAAAIVVNLVTAAFAIPADMQGSRAPFIEGAPQLRVAMASASSTPTAQDDAKRWIEAEHPDIVAILQVNWRWQSLADRLKAAYPYVQLVDSSDDYGVLLLSRLPFRRPTVSTAGMSQLPVVVTEVQTTVGKMGLIVAHAPPLISNANAYDRNTYLSQIHAMMIGMPIPTLLVGSLNAPPWSTGFDGLKTLPNLVPASLSLPATWPAMAGPLGVPLDYILLATPAGVAPSVDMRSLTTQHPFAASGRAGLMATVVESVR